MNQQIGSYVLERELGRGGMGRVYQARHNELGRRVAIKVLLTGVGTSPGELERFHIEARSVARLKHAGIVTVHELGTHNGHPYLVMDLIEGTTLGERVARGGALDPEQAAVLVRDLADAVQHAHAQGILHRDLKPANVLVDLHGRPILMDFGLARDLSETRERLTRTGEVMGTPAYMPPEQANGDLAKIGPASDVYGLGAILYFVLTAKPPFEGGGALQILHRVLNEPVSHPSRWRVDLNAGLEAICLKCLSKAPAERYASAGELSKDLSRYLGGEATTVRPRGRRSARPYMLVAAAVVAVCGFGLAASLGGGPRPLSPRELAVRSEALSKEAQALFAGQAPLRAQVLDEIAGRLDAVRALAPDGQAKPPALREADRVVGALRGLLALEGGDLAGANAALTAIGEAKALEAQALRGAIAAVTTDADPGAAVRDLDRVFQRGVARPELRRWRLRARARTDLSRASEAEAALDDVVALEALGELRPGELTLRVRALCALGALERAEVALKAIEAPPADLRWTVALSVVEEYLVSDPQRALERLRGLPAQDPPDPRREEFANSVYRAARAVALQEKRDKGADAQLLALLRVGHCLRPHPPPPELVEALLKRATTVEHSPDLRLAACLADVCPDDLTVQRAVSVLGQRSVRIGSRSESLPALRRLLVLETEPYRLMSARVALVSLLARINNRYDASFDEAECRELLEHTNALLSGDLPDAPRPLVLNARAVARLRTGDLEGALQDATAALDAAPTGSGFRLTRLRVHLALGHDREAFEDARSFATTTQINAESSAQATILTWSLGRKLGRELEAIKPIEGMLAGRPYATWWVRLAYLHLKTGDAEAAKRALGRAGKALALSDQPAVYAKYDSLPRAIAALLAVVEARGALALPEATALVDQLDAWRAVEAKQSYHDTWTLLP